jgi:hypothetical protein
MHGAVLHYFMLHIKRDYLYMKTDRIFLLLIKIKSGSTLRRHR